MGIRRIVLRSHVRLCAVGAFTGPGLSCLCLKLNVSVRVVEQAACNPGTGFGIGQSMVMACQIVAARRRDRLKLIIGKPFQLPPGRSQRTVKMIVGVG